MLEHPRRVHRVPSRHRLVPPATTPDPVVSPAGSPRNNVTVAEANFADQGPEPASGLDPRIADRLQRDGNGLLPAVIQQHDTREVLMVGWMDDEALHRTLTSGLATFWSRSRGEYWVKGQSSGNRQRVYQMWLDCDGDTLLVAVSADGPACHTGTQTCFDDRMLPIPYDRARTDRSENS